MVDAWLGLQPTAGPMIVTNCITVAPEGRFRLDLNKQEFYGEGTTTIFESSLNEREVQILRGLLDAEEVKSLPPYVEPVTPLPSGGGQTFIADISRGSTVQHVGYFSWIGEELGDPDSVKKDWKQSEAALQPLVKWFRALKSYKRPNWRHVSNSNITFCDTEPWG
jgi:hypothetical protein